MNPSTPQDEQNTTSLEQLEDIQTFHHPRPPAENRFYVITVGKEPGVYLGTSVYIFSILKLSCTDIPQSDDWHAQLDDVPGSAVRSFDTLKAAKQVYGDAVSAGLVQKIKIKGDKCILTEEDIPTIPGMQGLDADIHLLLVS